MLRSLTAGESHGEALVVLVDGRPAGGGLMVVRAAMKPLSTQLGGDPVAAVVRNCDAYLDSLG